MQIQLFYTIYGGIPQSKNKRLVGHTAWDKKVVEVWRMIAEGTVEEKMNSLQQEKRELFQKVIQGNEEQLAKMTEEDIRTILSIGE